MNKKIHDSVLIASLSPPSSMYILTPAGIKSKMQLSRAFLKRKLDEYEMLKMEIEELKRDVGPDQSLPD